MCSALQLVVEKGGVLGLFVSHALLFHSMHCRPTILSPQLVVEKDGVLGLFGR